MLTVRSLRSLLRLSSAVFQPSSISFAASSSYLHTSCSYRIPEPSSKATDEYPKNESAKRKSRKPADDEAASLVKFGHMFEQVPADERNKENFQKAIGLFIQRNVHRRGQVEFIYTALRHMKEFGVLRDLETYKRLLEIFPKGKMIAENYLQYAMKHFPKHQDCCTAVLDQMEYYFCYPDKEVYNIVKNAFGENSYTMIKMKRMMYWMPKFRYANPYGVPDPLPSAAIDLAKIAIQRMCRDPANEVHVWYTEAMPDPPEKTWVVCGQSCHQKQLIIEHDETKPLYVDGPFREWLYNESVSYFVLLADPRPDKIYEDLDPEEPESADDWANWETKFSTEFPQSRKDLIKAPTVHEQDDGTIMSIGITGSSSKESLVCWIHFLQRMNPKLAKIPVVFRLAHGIGELVVQKSETDSSKESELQTTSANG